MRPDRLLTALADIATKMKRVSAIAAVLLAMIGCDSRGTMTERFSDGEVTILTDAVGNKYAASHHFGNTYSLKPLK